MPSLPFPLPGRSSHPTVHTVRRTPVRFGDAPVLLVWLESGDNTAVPAGITLDLDGGTRQKPLPDGEYAIEVQATDAQGEPIGVALFTLLPIEGIDFSEGLIKLVSGHQILGFDSILEIHDGNQGQ